MEKDLKSWRRSASTSCCAFGLPVAASDHSFFPVFAKCFHYSITIFCSIDISSLAGSIVTEAVLSKRSSPGGYLAIPQRVRRLYRRRSPRKSTSTNSEWSNMNVRGCGCGAVEWLRPARPIPKEEVRGVDNDDDDDDVPMF